MEQQSEPKPTLTGHENFTITFRVKFKAKVVVAMVAEGLLKKIITFRP
jgi:hypothetical protein